MKILLSPEEALLFEMISGAAKTCQIAAEQCALVSEAVALAIPQSQLSCMWKALGESISTEFSLLISRMDFESKQKGNK